MNRFRHCAIQVFIIILNIQSICWAKKLESFQALHKKVSDELISIRKEFSATQPKIYALLDQVDTMNRIIQEVYTKKIAYKKKYHDLANQTDLLKHKNLMLKGKVQTLTDELEKVAQHLAQEQQLTIALKDEQDRLKASKNNVKPILDSQNNQSLNLTSTSEPISPR